MKEKDRDLEATKEFNPEDIFEDLKEEIISEDKEKEPLEVIVFDEATKKKNKKKKNKDGKKKENIFKKLIEKFKSLKKWQKALVIFLIILVICGIGFLTYWLINKNNDKNKDNKKDTIVLEDNYRYENGVLYILGKDGKDIGSYECENKDEKKCYVAYELSDDNFDVAKKELEDGAVYKKRSKVYQENYVFIFDNKDTEEGNIKLYNLKDKKEVEQYSGVKSYNTTNENYVVLKTDDNKYGLSEIKAEGINSLIDSTYDYMGIVEGRSADDSVVVKLNNKWSIISYENKIMLRNSDYEIKNYNDNYAVVVDGSDNYLVIDFKNETVTMEKYAFIELLEKYIITVNVGNILKIIDFSGNKYTEDGYQLESHDYVPTNVYNSKGGLIETKSAYSISIKDNIITLKINGEKSVENRINILDGVISLKYNFYSYYNGYLYFYGNLEKTDLIGSYKCTNKNTLNNTNSVFDKCFVATDTSFEDNEMTFKSENPGVTPIYNARYTFISDGDIKLYDLIDKKALGAYSAVNTYSRFSETQVYLESVNNKIVVAKNKSNKFGIIKIMTNTINSVLGFDYDSIEEMGLYYLAKKGSTWTLFDNSGNKVSGDFSEQVRMYSGSFVTTKSGNRYKVYKIDGTRVGTDEFKYARVYDTVFAGVDDGNNLFVYDYQDTNKPITKESIKLSNTNYYGSNATAFDLSVSGNNLTIIAGGKTYVYDMQTKELIS